MSIHFLLSALRARLRVFMLILLATVATATIVSLIMPKTYIATASLLVDSRDDQSMTPQGQAMPERERVGYMQTQLDILKSERVARKVVRDLNMVETYQTLSAFDEGSAPKTKGNNVEDWLAAGLLKHLKLDSSTSSIIRVSYASSSPEFSQTIANAFAKAYMDTVLDLRVEPSRQTAAWFEQQAKGLRTDLEQAQSRLTEFERAKGIIAADERYDMESSRLTELSNEVARAQSQSADAGSRAHQARVGSGALTEVLNNPLIQNLKTDLARSEARLKEMSAQLGVNHPGYQRQLAETQELRSRVEMESKRLVEAIGHSADQSHQREAGLMGALEAQRQRVMNMRQYRAQLSTLTHDVDAAQRAYDTAIQRSLASRVEGSASHANVSVLNPAVEPTKAARPRIGLNISLSILAGLMFALGAVGLMETFDRRVRSIEDLESELHVPLLAELNPWDSEKTRLLGVVHPYDALPGPG
ncbi:MAG TPA: chain length determinant protein EpsF [Rhodocyclaceae bacterium]|nr:chain length determinant protein EpsF [Rhodocyclaceae bacterium]